MIDKQNNDAPNSSLGASLISITAYVFKGYLFIDNLQSRTLPGLKKSTKWFIIVYHEWGGGLCIVKTI